MLTIIERVVEQPASSIIVKEYLGYDGKIYKNIAEALDNSYYYFIDKYNIKTINFFNSTELWGKFPDRQTLSEFIDIILNMKWMIVKDVIPDDLDYNKFIYIKHEKFDRLIVSNKPSWFKDFEEAKNHLKENEYI